MVTGLPDAGTARRASGRRCMRAADALRRVLEDPAVDLEPEMREQAAALHTALTLCAVDALLQEKEATDG